jgi:hypothetical protein
MISETLTAGRASVFSTSPSQSDHSAQRATIQRQHEVSLDHLSPRRIKRRRRMVMGFVSVSVSAVGVAISLFSLACVGVSVPRYVGGCR